MGHNKIRKVATFLIYHFIQADLKIFNRSYLVSEKKKNLSVATAIDWGLTITKFLNQTEMNDKLITEDRHWYF